MVRYVKVENERNRKPWTKRASKHSLWRKDNEPVERGIRGPARNLFTPENYNGASATREFVPLLAPSPEEGRGRGEEKTNTPRVYGVSVKKWTRCIEAMRL